MTAAATHGLNDRNATPPTSRIITSSCGAYATDDSASEAKIGSAMRLGSNWSSSCPDVSGSPSRSRFAIGVWAAGDRSEEHTSELQSLMRISYAVFCLKKNNKNQTSYT